MYALGAERSNENRPQGEVLMPTPRTTDMNGPGSHGTGGDDLRTVVSLLPTPQVADVTGGHKTRSGNRSNELLLPGVAEYLSGESTSPRSADGKTSSDGWPLPPPIPMGETDSTDSLLGSWSG